MFGFRFVLPSGAFKVQCGELSFLYRIFFIVVEGFDQPHSRATYLPAHWRPHQINQMAQFSASYARQSFRASTGESGLRVIPESFRTRLVQMAEETVESLHAIWQEAGYEEGECQSLLGDLLNKMKQTCAAELAAEQQILEHAKQQVLSRLQEYTTFCAQLGRPAPGEEVPSGNNYTDKLADLERLISGISGEVAQRQKLINTEFSAIEALVVTLGEPAPAPEQFNGPEGTPQLSDLRLSLLKAHRAELETVKKTRAEQMLDLAKSCVQIMNDLVVTEEGFASIPDADLYADCDAGLLAFAKSGMTTLTLGQHSKDFSALTQRCKALADEKERRREELASSGAEIARLWTLLRIPLHEREQFQSSFRMNLSLATLGKGREELERLQVVRVQSLGRVTASIRADILTLWEEAGVESEEQRRAEFEDYFTPLDELEDSAVRAVLCCVVLCCAVLCCAVLCCVWGCAVLCCAVLCCVWGCALCCCLRCPYHFCSFFHLSTYLTFTFAHPTSPHLTHLLQ